jgi:hypothetical protein
LDETNLLIVFSCCYSFLEWFCSKILKGDISFILFKIIWIINLDYM